MSFPRFCIIPARALADRRLKPADIMVLNALGVFGDREGWCFPSHASIVDMVGAHDRTVRKSLARLVDCGYVDIRARNRPNGSQISNEYRILFDFSGDQLSLAVGVGLEAQGGGPVGPGGAGLEAHPLTSHLTPHLTPQRKKPQTPLPVDKPRGVLKKEMASWRGIDHALTDFGRDMARRAAPGWDIHYLMQVYDGGVRERGIPDSPDYAFAAWCKAYTKGKQP